MSGIWGWFGGGGSQRTNNAPKNAILGLRAQLDMLQKREAHLMNQINEQDAIARKNVNTNKNGTSVHSSVAPFSGHLQILTELTTCSRENGLEAQESERTRPRADLGTD